MHLRSSIPLLSPSHQSMTLNQKSHAYFGGPQGILSLNNTYHTQGRPPQTQANKAPQGGGYLKPGQAAAAEAQKITPTLLSAEVYPTCTLRNLLQDIFNTCGKRAGMKSPPIEGWIADLDQYDKLHTPKKLVQYNNWQNVRAAAVAINITNANTRHTTNATTPADVPMPSKPNGLGNWKPSRLKLIEKLTELDNRGLIDIKDHQPWFWQKNKSVTHTLKLTLLGAATFQEMGLA